LSPESLLRAIAAGRPAPAYLFIGPDAYERDRCRRALIEKMLGPGGAETGLTRVDLEETSLSAVLDDARSFSLFAPQRVIWASSAEAVLPRGRAVDEDSGGVQELAAYLRDPNPGATLVFDCQRYEFEGDDKTKMERLRKFFAAIPDQVEFRRFTVESARRVAQELAKSAGLRIAPAELGMLVEALGGDAARIASEIEKLALYAGTERPITTDDIAQLVPNAQETTIFALVGALGRGDRRRALEALDTLLREGEYLPLALSFLATQFRMALVAQEAGLRTSQQILSWSAKEGIRMWRDRAEQVAQTVSAFPRQKLQKAVEKLFQADRALRDARPDDRVVMEELVFSLTT
jgi:DNA polymerase-3 subunit delta